MPDIQLGLWDNDTLAGPHQHLQKRYLIHSHVTDMIYECSATSEQWALAKCNQLLKHTDIVCIGIKPVLRSVIQHGKYTDLWMTKKSPRR